MRRVPQSLGSARGVAGLALALVAAMLVLACPAQPSYAGNPGSDRRAMRADPGGDVRQQTVRLKWKGTSKKKRRIQTKSAVVPGIGRIRLVCRPDTTMIELRSGDPMAETQMWMAKYESKAQRAVVAVKTARIYRYAHAGDDGTGGTGPTAHEGLNQGKNVENYSSGYLHGVISQRPGRQQPLGTLSSPPSTAFELDWYWNGFDHPQRYRSCDMRLRLRTRLDNSLALNWHGDADSVGNDVRSTSYPDLGVLTLACAPGPKGRATLALQPNTTNAEVYVEEVSGEGYVEDHVDDWTVDLDPVTGALGPIVLPTNGMMRLFFRVGGVKRSFILSSYDATNNTENPALNVCEIALAPW